MSSTTRPFAALHPFLRLPESGETVEMPGNESCFGNCQIFVSGVNATFQVLSHVPKGGLWTEHRQTVSIQFNADMARMFSHLVVRALSRFLGAAGFWWHDRRESNIRGQAERQCRLEGR